MKKIVLQYGDTDSKKISTAQMYLKAAGSNLELNGEYTIGMVSAVRNYQKKKGLPITGKIDRRTWRMLKREISIFKVLFGR